MAMRPATDLNHNPAGLVDKRIGEMYLAMETIIGMAPKINAVADNITSVLTVAENVGVRLTTVVVSGTAPLAGNSNSTAHGRVQSRIRDYNVQILDSNNLLVKPDTVDFVVTVNANNINIALSSDATNLSGRAFTCLITYEVV